MARIYISVARSYNGRERFRQTPGFFAYLKLTALIQRPA
jgi:hypothetical protein